MWITISFEWDIKRAIGRAKDKWDGQRYSDRLWKKREQEKEKVNMDERISQKRKMIYGYV